MSEEPETGVFLQIVSGEIRELTDDEKEEYPMYRYTTVSPFSYDYGDHEIIVPLGFLTDGSSGGPDYGSSWLFHDYLYATHRFTSDQECTRKEADRVMKRVLHNERLSWYCWIFAKVARINPFYIFSRAWRNSGERGVEILGSTGDNVYSPTIVDPRSSQDFTEINLS